MQDKSSLGGYRSISEFVDAKLNRFQNMDHTFEALFEMMFSERENIMYEKSIGYKIEYTSYGKAYSLVHSTASQLKVLLAEQSHDRVVGLYMDNDMWWIVTFWAILAAGFRPLLLNIRLSDEVIAQVLKNMDGVAVITDGKTFSDITCIPVTELRKDSLLESDMDSKQPAIDTPANAFGTEILVMSSGTTNFPKVCAYTGEAFFWQIHDSAQLIRENPLVKRHYHDQLKLLAFLPFYHVFGLIAVYMWFSFFSRTFVHLNDFSSNTVLNTIRRHEVTHIFAVPLFWNTVYAQAIKTIRGRGEDTWKKFNKGLQIAEQIGDVPVLGNLFVRSAFKEVRENLFGDSICFLISGGSEISTEVLSFFNAIGYHLSNGYGATEIGITSVELSNKRKILNRGYVGKPLQSVEYRINEEGELLVRGKTTAKYMVVGDETINGGEWFNTHDLAEEHNGRYLIGGRRDDLVIAPSGENLNPNVIEELLRRDLSLETALIGPKENNKVTPTLLVSPGRILTEESYETLREQVEEALKRHSLIGQINRLVITRNPLMYTDEIKCNRTRLRRDYEKGLIQEMVPMKKSAEGEESEITQLVRKMFATALDQNPEELSADGDFFLDYGGTSLDYFTILAKLKEDYLIAFPASEDGNLNSIKGLSSYIENILDHVD